MANVTLAQLEDAVLSALAPLDAGEVGGYLRTRKAYQGELDVETADQLSVQWPAALVFIESLSFTPTVTNGQEYAQRPQVTVFLGDQNWRGKQEARRGSGAAEIGTYRMIQDVLARLVGQTFGLDVGPLAPKEVKSLLSLASPPTSIYRLTFESDGDYTAP